MGKKEKHEKHKNIQQIPFFWGSLDFFFFLLLCVFFLFFLVLKKGEKEGFTWSPSTQNQFLQFQSTVHPRFAFDVREIQNQATEEEVMELLRTGFWPWNEKVQQDFIQHVQHNPNIKVNPLTALQNARSLYNQRVAQELLKKPFKNVGDE
jgi:hypothetical protein